LKFEELYDLHYSTIFNYCYRRIGDFEISRDVTSETFLKVYLKYDTFEDRGIPRLNWVYRIASNEINLYYRAQKYNPVQLKETFGVCLENLYSVDTIKEMENAEAEIKKNKEFIILQEAIKTLPIKYQEVITLKYFEKKKVKEISQILTKKEGTVKSLLSRGVSKLKVIIESNY